MKNQPKKKIELSNEYSSAEFGDRRLSDRLERVVERVGAAPGLSLPKAMKTEAELEGVYRFLNNDKVSCRAIVAPHIRETALRVGDGRDVVVAHDTTEFNFGEQREGLGHVGRGKSFGFYGHFALAVKNDAHREPLGVLGMRLHRRMGGLGRRGHRALAKDNDNEGLRWMKLVVEVEAALGLRVKPMHAFDREGDAYSILAALVARESRFVIRMATDKRHVVGDDDLRVRDVLAKAESIAEREVPISARGRSKMPSTRKGFPKRNARMAKLEITAERVTLIRPSSAPRDTPLELTLNIIRVFEPAPPAGEAPIEWRLWTSEPIATARDALAVIDAYRCRWRIEEYFKALKTGCAIESRQLETFRGLANALCLYLPIAWRLLLLRSLAREKHSLPARMALTPVQMICLRAELRKLKRPALRTHPTIYEAMLGVAGLGGHIRNNSDPGWATLAHGMSTLLALEAGFLIAKRCDQS
jgi:hypothetical protein